jgi:hypothetical protein
MAEMSEQYRTGGRQVWKINTYPRTDEKDVPASAHWENKQGSIDLAALYTHLKGHSAFASVWSWDKAYCVRLIPEKGRYRVLPFPQILSDVFFAIHAPDGDMISFYPTSTRTEDPSYTADFPAIFGISYKTDCVFTLYHEGEVSEEEIQQDFYRLVLSYRLPGEGKNGMVYDHGHPFNLPTAVGMIRDLMIGSEDREDRPNDGSLEGGRQ